MVNVLTLVTERVTWLCPHFTKGVFFEAIVCWLFVNFLKENFLTQFSDSHVALAQAVCLYVNKNQEWFMRLCPGLDKKVDGKWKAKATNVCTLVPKLLWSIAATLFFYQAGLTWARGQKSKQVLFSNMLISGECLIWFPFNRGFIYELLIFYCEWDVIGTQESNFLVTWKCNGLKYLILLFNLEGIKKNTGSCEENLILIK